MSPVATQLHLTKYININISLSIYWIADERHGQAKNFSTNKSGLTKQKGKENPLSFPRNVTIWWTRQTKLTDDKSTSRLME